MAISSSLGKSDPNTMNPSPSSIPDVATLRAMCHGAKVSRDSRWWYVLQRRFSIHLTWLLLHTGIQPNQVTMISVAFAVLGAALTGMRAPGWVLAGGLAFLAHHVFDKVDGDVARFLKRHSIVGVYLDELGHSLAFAGIFLGLGLHLAWNTPAPALIPVLLASALGALAMVLGRQQKSIGFLLYAQYALAQPELVPRREAVSSVLTRAAAHEHRRGSGSGGGFVPRVRDLVLQASDFSLMVLLLIAGAAVEMATGSDAFLRGLLFAEAGLQAAVFAALVVVNATVNVESEIVRIDAEQKGSDAPGANR